MGTVLLFVVDAGWQSSMRRLIKQQKRVRNSPLRKQAFFFFLHIRKKHKHHYQPPGVTRANTNNLPSLLVFIMQSFTPAVLSLPHTQTHAHSLPLPKMICSVRSSWKLRQCGKGVKERMEKTCWISSDKANIKLFSAGGLCASLSLSLSADHGAQGQCFTRANRH